MALLVESAILTRNIQKKITIDMQSIIHHNAYHSIIYNSKNWKQPIVEQRANTL